MAEPDILYINDVANSLIIENSNQLNISNMSEALELNDVSFQIFDDNIKITGRK